MKDMLTTNKKVLIFTLLILAGGLIYGYRNHYVSKFAPLPSSTAYTTENIVVDFPISHSIITSPLVIHGRARGSWFFEASFPVKLLDADGNIVAFGSAQAKGDWMTTEFVPFEITLTFTKPRKQQGTLLLEKDNPSGLAEKVESISIPIRFYP